MRMTRFRSLTIKVSVTNISRSKHYEGHFFAFKFAIKPYFSSWKIKHYLVILLKGSED